MLKALVYYLPTCPYCIKAFALLEQKSIEIIKINIENAPERKVEMSKLTGKTSVPQIFFINKWQHIGGCDDLYELEATQQLDNLLKDHD